MQGNTLEEATSLNLPVRVLPGRVLDARRLAVIGSSAVIIDAVKKAEEEDCLIVRTHECRGGTQKACLTSEYDLAALTPCNLMEEAAGEPMKPGEPIVWKPFEIKTFKLKTR